MPVAKDVAKALRHSTGGLRYVKALGLEVDGQAQVSMNLVDTEKTPLFRAFEMVKMEAAAQGVEESVTGHAEFVNPNNQNHVRHSVSAILHSVDPVTGVRTVSGEVESHLVTPAGDEARSKRCCW